MAVFAVAWLWLSDRAVLAPPTDNIEQLIWVRSLEWGYYKHPPLPTWLLWPVVQALGWTAWATYLLGAACTLGAFALMWGLLRGMRGEAYAATAALAGLCVTFYNGRLYFYNHEIVLIPLVAGCAAACWKAYSTRKIGWWIVLGACLGLGGLAKYQMAVAGLAVLLFWLSQKAWRDPMHVFGLQVAGLTALAVFAPHLIWLINHDFEPLQYAMSSSLAAGLPWGPRLHEIANWWGDQLFNRAFPAWVFLAVLGGLGRWPGARSATAAAQGSGGGLAPSPVSARASSPAQVPSMARAGEGAGRALLLYFGLTPLVFVSVMTLVSGSHIQLHWGTPFLLFIVPAVMELTRSAWAGPFRPRQAVLVFIVIQLLLMVRVELTSPTGAGLLRRASDWRFFDAQALADTLHERAVAELGGPVKVISGAWAESGALALRLPDKPLVLIDGQFQFSPWVSAGLVADCGALELLRAKTPPAGYGPVGPAFPLLYWRVKRPKAACAPGATG
ncbi:glycosyl transferase [Achromobacter sp. UMC71]|nr:glycosyltransferase family 39 protein [Achromobacter sp. UMC71]MBB1624886.1 glycosyl transferase [Achromobacter sp. UMC71]